MHHRYTKNNNPKSAYALHIFNNRHKYGTLHHIMGLPKTWEKGHRM